MTPTFNPSTSGHSNEDQRDLSLMIQKCNIIREDGLSIELISGKKSA
jgi:hypothetical protein